MHTLGDRIRHIREQRGMDQGDVAAKIGISAPSLSQIECGVTKMPRPTTLMKLAEILETNQRWLLFGEGDATQRDMVVSDPVALAQYEVLQPQHRAAINAMIATFRNIEDNNG